MRAIGPEGLFPSSQQTERFLGTRSDAPGGSGIPEAWGFSQLQIDREALSAGCLSIQSARGVLPDGTPFSIPDKYPAPPPLEVGFDVRNRIAFLAVLACRSGLNESAETNPRQLNFGYVLEGEPRDAFCTMEMVRLTEKSSTGAILLDETFIPPALECRSIPRLQALLQEVHALLRQGADALAARLVPSSPERGGKISEFLMLQVINRFDPWLAHLVERESLHPETFYVVLLQLAGELSTFSAACKRRVKPRTPYRHHDLCSTFEPLVRDIREFLTEVVHRHTAMPVPLQERAKGLYTALLPDANLLRQARFVLIVKAQVHVETLRQHFPAQIKIGPPERIRDLLISHLPGVMVQALPMAPPGLPCHAGFSYFELDRHSKLWESLEISKLLALHISGQFPGLQIELWALPP